MELSFNFCCCHPLLHLYSKKKRYGQLNKDEGSPSRQPQQKFPKKRVRPFTPCPRFHRVDNLFFSNEKIRKATYAELLESVLPTLPQNFMLLLLN